LLVFVLREAGSSELLKDLAKGLARWRLELIQKLKCFLPTKGRYLSQFLRSGML